MFWIGFLAGLLLGLSLLLPVVLTLRSGKLGHARKHVVPVLLMSAFTLLAAEVAYRVWLSRTVAQQEEALTYRFVPYVYIAYDERHGAKFKPDSESWVCHVENGRLVRCGTVSRSNRDGLGGATTLEQYRAARIKILVFGDSFTHWNQEGVTWPDLLQQRLRETLGDDVAVLNFGRGTYGVLQMLDLAADKVEELRPDLVIVAPIGNDFFRDRWWAKEVQHDGMTRWMLSSRPDQFLDYRVAIDEIMVYPPATKEWALQRLAAGGEPDAVLEGANAQYRRLRREVLAVRSGFEPRAVDRSYLLRRLTTGNALRAIGLNVIPQVSYTDYLSDERTLENLARLRASAVPLLWVYLPTAAEMASKECHLDPQSRQLMASLERLAGQQLRLIQREYQGTVPARMDLLPIDGHPNRDGLQLYADAVAPMAAGALQRTGDQPGAATSSQ